MGEPEAAEPREGDARSRLGESWALIREALRGSHHTYTEGSIPRAVFLLAVPMVLEMALESVFAVVDVFWVSRLGPDAVAAVGLTESMLALVYAMALGISMAAAAMVARRIGERDPRRAASTAVQAIGVGVCVAVPIGVLGAVFGRDLLALMGAPAGVLANAGFTRVILGTNVVILLLFLNNAIFRGAGDAAIAMRSLWFANAVNLVLDPCFIFGLGPFPRLGVTGAAVATSCGRGLGVVFQLAVLARRKGRIRIERDDLRLDPKEMWTLLRVSGTGILQNVIGMASWTGLVRILAGFGAAALAGYTIAIRVVIFALLPSWGMSNAAATLVGQNLGAKRPDRAERSVWTAGLYNMVFLGAVSVLFVFASRPLVRLFTQEPAVVAYGADGLRVIACGFVFYAWGMVMAQSFNGAGDTVTPTWLNLACFWLWEIPLAWVLAQKMGLGPHGVFISIAVAFSTFAVASAAVFRMGRWKRARV
jgi:putative MATE family efflux protein